MKRSIILAILSLVLVPIWAQTFEYKVTDSEVFSCTVINEELKEVSIGHSLYKAPYGVVKIPTTVTDENGTVYKVVKIADDGYYNIINVTGLDFSAATYLREIGHRAFLQCQLSVIDLSPLKNLEVIGDQAFYNCYPSAIVNLAGLTSLESIGDYAFYNCKKATNALNLSGLKSLRTIGEYAFFKCYRFSSITLPEGLVTIGKGAFEECKTVKEFVVPASVEAIGLDAFAYMTGVTHFSFAGVKAPKLLNGRHGFAGNVYIPCETTKEEWLAADTENTWAAEAAMVKETCPNLKITHHNLTLDGYDKTCDAEYVKSITYKRKFTPGKWETLYLPFTVDEMIVEDWEGAHNILPYPWNPSSGGYYYLARLQSGTYNFGVETKMQAHTPYIIQFTDPYYADKIITFKHNASGLYLITNSFAEEYDPQTMAGNNTMQPQYVSDVYYLNSSGNMFEFTESTVTLQPFECYITPAPESQMAQMPRRMSIPSPSQISTATSLPMIEANELLWQIVGNTLVVATGGQPVNVYTINGVLLQSFAAGEDCVSINLTNGCYILQSGNAVQKIVF